MANFETIRDARDELVLADLHMAILFAPYSAAGITTLEDPTSGDLSTTALASYTSGGIIEKGAGVDFSQGIHSTDIEAYGESDPVRTIINKRSISFKANFLETRVSVLEKFWGMSLSNIVPTTTGGVVIQVPTLPQNIYYRCVMIGQDDVNGAPFYPYYIMPRVKLEKVGDQKLKDDGTIDYDLTFKAFRDSALGFAVAQGWCGPGWLNLVARAGFVATPQVLTVTGIPGLAVTAAAGGQNDVWTIGVGGATAGTFTLTFGTQTTAAIAYNATAAAVQSALVALTNIGAGNVLVAGAAPTWTVTFQGTLADTPETLSGSGASLTGGSFSATHTTTGGAHTTQLKVTGDNGINYTPLAGYSSSDPTKATVSASGLVTGVATGSPTVTASFVPQGALTAVTGTASVTVS